MSHSGPARMTVWLLAIAIGGFGWWLASGVASDLFGWPRASYSHAIGFQFSAQLMFHSLAAAMGALIGKENQPPSR